jgi:hypothetical protein
MKPEVEASGRSLTLYLSLFRGREDHFAQQHDTYYCPVPKPLDPFYLGQHLAGDATFGMYVLTSRSCCHFFCVDIDIPKADLKETNFADRTAKHDCLGQHLRETIKTLTETLCVPPEALLLEETGGRGYHIWIFLKDALSGDSAVAFGAALKSHLAFEIEFFPKQGQLTPSRKLGNLVKLPLGVHRKYGARSVFFTLSGGEPQYTEGLEPNFELLAGVVPADPTALLATVSVNAELVEATRGVDWGSSERELRRPLFRGDLKTLTTHCTAIRNLRSRAEAGQKFTRAEAFHFTNILLSAEQGQDFVVETLRASYGGEYDERKTLSEIEKIRTLFPTSCATLVEQGLCPKYCKEGVRKRNSDPLLTNTTPCGVWLTRLRGQATPEAGDVVARIGEPGNVRRAFFQLKAYHEHEDALFFDPFDFEQFEQDLPSNCEIIAASLRERSAPPLTGYLAVEIPKKLDTEYHLVHRRMAYSTVYDQVPIQAVFNIVAPLIEDVFHDGSYGYRWNSDEHNPNRIFDDWREAYPRFRAQILAALRGNPNGFHICCDIKGYYDHVDQAILVEQLREIIKDGHVLEYITDVVAIYRHDEGAPKGLPQGPAYARLLANLYLNDFDRFAASQTTKYLRYVDDLFLFFESKENAERGLHEVVQYLRKLGLELSEADDKRPTVTPNTDESRVRQSLDNIQYGILEGTRQLKHLDHRVVSDFSHAVERHKVSPESLDDLLKLNDYIPSLLYIVTEEALIPHPLRGKVWNIVKYLIEHHWFCSKRLKKVFYRLLDLSPNDGELGGLYGSMDPAHKVYFVLSVYGAYLTSGKHRELLELVSGKAAQDQYPFLRGFGLAIANRLGLGAELGLASVSYIQELERVNSYFASAKWLSEVAYLSLGDEERAALRQLVKPDSKNLLKVLVLGNLGGEPRTYLDGKYLCNLIDGADPILLPAVCSAIVSVNNTSDLFGKLLEFASSRPALKPFVIAMLSTKLFDSRLGAGRAQVENLRLLYEHIADPEIKRVLLTGLLRISGAGLPDANGVAFAKCHLHLAQYNECLLFQHIGQSTDYDCLEQIPVSRLRQYVPKGINEIKDIIEDLADKAVLPPLRFIYDSQSEEVSLQFHLVQGFKPVSKDDFHLDRTSILRSLRLAAQVYKKACYFRRMLGKAPFIDIDNLLVSENGTTIVFRTVGKSLRSPYLIDGAAIGDEEEDIPRMVGVFLARLLVGDSQGVQAFVKAAHTEEEAFLALFIKNMASKGSAEPYSCTRFNYIVEKLLATAECGEQQLAGLYMLERLKGDLFRRNRQRVTWYGVSGTVGEHVSHLREICSKQSLHDFPFRDRLALSVGPSRRLHWLSRQLLNLALNRGIGPTGGNLDQSYAALVEHLLLFSAVSIEILSLCRAVRRGASGPKLPLAFPNNCGSIRISAGGYERAYSLSELTAAVRAYSTELELEENPETTERSLSQMMLQVLLAFDARVDGDRLCVCDAGAMPTLRFNALAHACLVRVPRIEEDLRVLITAVLEALRNNDEMVPPAVGANLREDLLILARDFGRARKSLRIRRSFGVASGKGYFPPDVKCWSLPWRTITAKASALPGSPLTSKLPASKYHCSWDLQAGSVVNLIVPNDGLNALLSDLKAGKFFAVKLTYLYSGKMMLFCDLFIVVVLFALLASCEYGTAALQGHAVSRALLSAGSKICVTIMGVTIIKMVVWDIGRWFLSWRSWIKLLRAANDTTLDNSK